MKVDERIILYIYIWFFDYRCFTVFKKARELEYDGTEARFFLRGYSFP